jgi:hypothetical protein
MSSTQGMMTLRELLEDPIYAKWFSKPPKEHEFTKWRVYVQKKPGKRWRKKDFDRWAPAHKFLMAHVGEWYNASLTCRNDHYRPPVVRYQGTRQYYKKVLLVEAHIWCPYCRRPTMFGYFTHHHNFPRGGIQPMPHFLRCGICGIREVEVRKLYRQLPGG